MVRKKATGKPFKKGQSGNPKGSSARAQSRKLKALARLSAEEVAEVGTLILSNNRDALAALGNDPNTSVIKVWMAGLIFSSMKNGDASIFRAVLDRVVGKAVETVQISGKDGAPVSLDVTNRRQLSEEEMLARADKLAKQRAEAGDD